MKYAKWKAVEIGKCLKSGITPTPGPPVDDTGVGYYSDQGAVGYDTSQFPPSGPGDATSSYDPQGEKPVPKPRHNLQQDLPPPSSFYPTPQSSKPPAYDPAKVGFGYDQGGAGELPPSTEPPGAGAQAASLAPEKVAKAQKLCKFAASALEYEDVMGAMDYLNQAMHLLKTGRELHK